MSNTVCVRARGTKKRANTTTAYTIASESFYATAIEPFTSEIIQKRKKEKPCRQHSITWKCLDWNRHRWLKTFNAESVQLSSLLRWEVVHFYSFNIKPVKRISDCGEARVRLPHRITEPSHVLHVLLISATTERGKKDENMSRWNPVDVSNVFFSSSVEIVCIRSCRDFVLFLSIWNSRSFIII